MNTSLCSTICSLKHVALWPYPPVKYSLNCLAPREYIGGNNKHLCSSVWFIKVHRNPQITKFLLTLTQSLKENRKSLHYPPLSDYLSALVVVVCAKMTKYAATYLLFRFKSRHRWQRWAQRCRAMEKQGRNICCLHGY